MLIIALTSPSIELQKQDDSVLSIDVLLDNTTSMEIYDIEKYESLVEEIKQKDIVVNLDYINTGDVSNIGDSLLKHISPFSKVLLISDGIANEGTKLEDVALFASSINSSIFTLELETDKKEVSVFIEGPSKVVSGVENEYRFYVRRTQGDESIELTITLDDEIKFQEKVGLEPTMQKFTFSSGEHQLKAEIKKTDVFEQNNIFYKSIRVVERPQLLYVTKDMKSPLLKIYESLYDVDIQTDIPIELDKYYSVVLNNLNSKIFTPSKIKALEEYASSGNGVLVIGGKDSFEYGGYNSSLISNLLPVNVGKAKKKKDIANIVISVDTGDSSKILKIDEEDPNSPTLLQATKAMALSVVENIALNARVGIIESNTNAQVITDGIYTLENILEDLRFKIPRISGHHAQSIYQTPLAAYRLMQKSTGSKNLLLITSGNVRTGTFYKESTLKNVREMYENYGMRTFVISSGKDASYLDIMRGRIDEADIEDKSEYLKQLAKVGGGQFWHTDAALKVSILFGDPDNKPSGEPELFIYDVTHFITKEQDSEGKVYGFNQVYPKANARLLLTTSGGDPILTVWRFGLGRVGVISSDDGSKWMSSLVRPENSRFLVRSMNWLIEDPERKNDFTVTFPEFYVGESSAITVRSDSYPEFDGLNFFEERKDIYKAYYTPEEQGFSPLVNSQIANNYNREFKSLGQTSQITKLAEITGGKKLVGKADEIIKEIQSSKQVISTSNVDLSWYFVAFAIVLYLIEVVARKIYEIKMSRKF